MFGDLCLEKDMFFWVSLIHILWQHINSTKSGCGRASQTRYVSIFIPSFYWCPLNSLDLSYYVWFPLFSPKLLDQTSWLHSYIHGPLRLFFISTTISFVWCFTPIAHTWVCTVVFPVFSLAIISLRHHAISMVFVFQCLGFVLGVEVWLCYHF
jgi:hypothetical protein